MKSEYTYINIMKKIVVLALSALLTSNAVLAEKLTVDEAKAVASKFFNGASAVLKASGNGQALSLAGASTGYYIFNRGTSSGYVIVAADDKVANQVLGYADEGTVDMAAMPENMAWWLAEYDRQMSYAGQNAVAKSGTAVAKYANIAPLLTSKWDQDSPYNDFCPVQRDTVCPTGCVATAVAQLMYYHKWPEKGTGSNAYNWNGEILSADFSQSTYDWSAMTDRYGNNSSDASKAAVALLMHDVGIAVNMEYEAKSSGAFQQLIAPALATYFSYDKNIKYVQRKYYGVKEWDDLVYKELAASRPVYYTGYTENYANGHAFACDGYRDGYFHINWGWGGVSNGYFLLTALDPDQQGIGGSSSGYSYAQDIVMNIQKPQENTVIEPLYFNDGNFSTSKTQATLSETLTFRGNFRNGGIYASTVNFGLIVVSADGDTTYVAGNGGSYRAGSGTGTFGVSMSQFPTAEGDYFIYPAYQDTSTKVWYKMQTVTGYAGYVVGTVSGSTVDFCTPEADASELTATNFAPTSSLYAGKSFTATATISNAGGEYYDKVYVAFMNVGASTYAAISNGALIGLANGVTQVLSFSGTVPSKAGDYELLLVDRYFNSISERVPVTVSAAPTGVVSMKLTNQLRVANPTQVAADNFSVSATIRGISGCYDNTLTLALFRNGENRSSDMMNKKIVVGEGDNVTVVFEGEIPSAEVGDKYIAALYYLSNGQWAVLPALGNNYNYLTFTVGHLSDIDDATTTTSTGETLVYTLSGTLVGTYKTAAPDMKDLPKGLYIVKRGSETRKVRN